MFTAVASRALMLLSFGAAALACGTGSSSAGTAAAPDFQAAAEELTLTRVAVAPGEEPPATSATAPVVDDPSYPKCHPRLFARTVAYSAALNYHLYLFLRDIDGLLKLAPRVQNDTTAQWAYTGTDGDSLQITLTKTAPGVFTIDESVAAAGSETFASVGTGNIDRSDLEDVKKELSFDLDALHKVLGRASDDKSAGQVAVSFDRATGSGGDDLKRSVTYTLTNFVPVYGDPHGPRTGSIFFLDEPGVGGAMLYETSVAFLCPSNPLLLASDATTYARWYVTGTGSTSTVTGRADARATGGQFPEGDLFVGLSCRSVSVANAEADTDGSTPDNAYWLLKEEGSSGTTVVSMTDTTAGDPPCNQVFGPVPSAGDAANDPTLPTAIPSSGAFPGQF